MSVNYYPVKKRKTKDLKLSADILSAAADAMRAGAEAVDMAYRIVKDVTRGKAKVKGFGE